MTLDHPLRGVPMATCSFREFATIDRPGGPLADLAVPIGTAVGRYRWLKGIIECDPLKPWSTFKKVDDPAKAEPIYQAQLTRDRQRIEERLLEIAAEHPDRVLVFLCYENLSKGKFCHRTWLARWLTAGYEIPVEELGAKPAADPPLL